MLLGRRTRRNRVAFAAVACFALLFCSSCKPTRPWAQQYSSSGERPSETILKEGARHDLSFDESFGGHTLKRHVGRTEEQLQQRLREEPNIAAASTYTDRATAEKVITAALQSNQEKVAQWLERSRHPNLVLDYDGEHPVGRSLKRGETEAQSCSHAIIVLHWDGPSEYHVLTSYPECR